MPRCKKYTRNKNMTFEITKQIRDGNCVGYTVDAKTPERCGSPTIGTGRTQVDAVIAFFLRLTPDEFTKIKEINTKESTRINNRYWKDILGSSKR